MCFQGLRFQGVHPFQCGHSTFLPTSSLRLAPRSGSAHIPDPSHSRGSAAAGPALHPVPPINALYLHRPHLSLTPSTSGMRRHRPYPIRLRPLPGSVRPRPSLTAEDQHADCAGARQRRGLLTPTRISLREGGKAIAGLTAGGTRGRASRRRSQRPRERGAGEAPRDGRCERGGGGPGLCWTEPASVGPGGRGRALRRRASRNPHAVSPEGEPSGPGRSLGHAPAWEDGGGPADQSAQPEPASRRPLGPMDAVLRAAAGVHHLLV